MAIETIVTGDDLALPVTLYKNDAVFAIGGTVSAAIVSLDHATKYTADISQSSLTSGADWTNSLVVVVMTAAQTAVVTTYGRAWMEIQVNDSGKLTWFFPVNVVQGQIA